MLITNRFQFQFAQMKQLNVVYIATTKILYFPHFPRYLGNPRLNT